MRPSWQGPFSAICSYLRPGPKSGGRLIHAAYVTGGSGTILPAVLPQGWQISLWDGCMVFGVTV